MKKRRKSIALEIMNRRRMIAVFGALMLTVSACGGAKSVDSGEESTVIGDEQTATADVAEENNIGETNPDDFSCIKLEDGTFAIKSYKGDASVVNVPEEIDGIKITSVDGINNKESITKIILPDTVTVIEDNAFSDNQNLEEVVLGNNVVTIGKRAFGLDTKLASITIPETVTEIGPSAFYVSGIVEVNIPSGVSVIEDSTFAGSTLESITIPGTVNTIGASAFMDSEIKEVIIEDGVQAIEDSAFSGCRNLARVEIPASVTSIATDFEKSCTIVAPSGSYAESFANENGYNFEAK